MLKLTEITKSYGAKLVLNAISLSFEKGKAYGIVGQNGAGKTTLFRTIAGLTTAHGRIDSDFKILKNHLGFLPTNPIFMSKITGWEYLKLLSLSRGIKDDDFEEQNVFELPLSSYAEHYSTGMQKKLAFMGILLQQNDIFILDEPFNGVDIQSNIMINAIIDQLKHLGKIILISSHIYSTLADACDEIHLLKNGSIAMSALLGEFHLIEQEMIGDVVGDKISKLRLK